MYDNYAMGQDPVEKNSMRNPFEGNSCDSHGCYFDECEEFPPHCECGGKGPEFPPHYDCDDKGPMFPPQCGPEVKPHGGQCGFGGNGAGFAGNGAGFAGNGAGFAGNGAGFAGNGAGFAGNGAGFPGNRAGIGNNAAGFSPNRGINVIPGQNRVIRNDYTMNGSINRIQNNNFYRNYYTRYNRYVVNTTNYMKSFVRDVNVYQYTSNTVNEGIQYCGCTTINAGCGCGC